MLTLDDKEFVRGFLRLRPTIEGSHLRAIKAAIALRRLLLLAEQAGLMATDPESVRIIALGLNQEGKEITPNEARKCIDIFNKCVEMTREP